ALSYRDPGLPLADDHEEDLFNGWDSLTLSHTGPSGRRTYKPDPQIRQTEIDRHRDITGQPPQTLPRTPPTRQPPNPPKTPPTRPPRTPTATTNPRPSETGPSLAVR
ncbi:hypothetical protein MWU75_07400, partial [Ornithinimicrobium sp. F0845]|uniref:hypothetical protein n=1 Tax=Ornithinimicrobium sp. F0845 TaxID=2926412 RepID=UPI001FF30D07